MPPHLALSQKRKNLPTTPASPSAVEVGVAATVAEIVEAEEGVNSVRTLTNLQIIRRLPVSAVVRKVISQTNVPHLSQSRPIELILPKR
jgi:hypothetical protein